MRHVFIIYDRNTSQRESLNTNIWFCCFSFSTVFPWNSPQKNGYSSIRSQWLMLKWLCLGHQDPGHGALDFSVASGVSSWRQCWLGAKHMLWLTSQLEFRHYPYWVTSDWLHLLSMPHCHLYNGNATSHFAGPTARLQRTRGCDMASTALTGRKPGT